MGEKGPKGNIMYMYNINLFFKFFNFPLSGVSGLNGTKGIKTLILCNAVNKFKIKLVISQKLK